jgi:hypothetical protein
MDKAKPSPVVSSTGVTNYVRAPASSPDVGVMLECSLHGYVHAYRFHDLMQKVIAMVGTDKQKTIYEHEVVCLPLIGKMHVQNFCEKRGCALFVLAKQQKSIIMKEPVLRFRSEIVSIQGERLCNW